MTEIYFINDFYIRTTSWKSAFRAFLNHYGSLTTVVAKSLNAMDNLDEILELMEMATCVPIRHIGIAKEFMPFVDYEFIREEGEV